MTTGSHFQTSVERLQHARQQVRFAGVVTSVFGVLWIVAIVASTFAGGIGRGQCLDSPGLFAGILLGLLFVALGVGVLRQQWWCGWLALGLAGLVIGGQLYLVFSMKVGSLFLLILSAVVALTNYVAARARLLIDQPC